MCSRWWPLKRMTRFTVGVARLRTLTCWVLVKIWSPKPVMVTWWWWWRLHMSEMYSSGTITTKKTQRYIIVVRKCKYHCTFLKWCIVENYKILAIFVSVLKKEYITRLYLKKITQYNYITKQNRDVKWVWLGKKSTAHVISKKYILLCN